MESCGLVENPQTGALISFIAILTGGLSILGIYKYTKKQKIFKI